jgi:magnesium chelatase family protein
MAGIQPRTSDDVRTDRARMYTASLCRVTATLERGLPGFTIVGLSEAAVREVRVRVRASLVSAGFEFPVCNVTVTIDPAAGKDGNTNFDLSIALALLVALFVVRCRRKKESGAGGVPLLPGEVLRGVAF